MVYLIGKLIFPKIFGLWIKEVKGLQNVPKKGAYIIVANHASYMDHFLIMCTLVPYVNRKIHHLAKKEHFDNILKRIWHNYAGAVPLDRESGGKETLRWAIKSLKQGKIIAIHPEGTRSLNGKLQKGKTGAARLALAARVPVLPLGLIGTFEILPKGKYIPKFKRATINIGKLMHFDRYYEKRLNKELLRNLTDDIMEEIAQLSRQKYNF
jgi:1-acyl-sn-glycerol-3-phosphate acyltransferase